jgi:transcriptional regulator with XRE-family HTH domain
VNVNRKQSAPTPTIDRAAIGERIRRARKSMGLTQEALARRIGSDDASVSLWEGGRRLPDTKRIVLLAITLRRTADFLLTGRPRRSELWRQAAKR